MAFERRYALRIFDTDDGNFTDLINEAVIEFDHPSAAASVACMSTNDNRLYILIEYWKERVSADGDRQQSSPGSVDETPARRQPRRARTRRADDTGTAARVEPEGVDQPVGASTPVTSEIDVPLPFVEPEIEWP